MELLKLTIKNNASDLHLSAGMPAMIRVDGDLVKLDDKRLLHQELLQMLSTLMSEKQRQDYERHLELDFAFEVAGCARFRVNVLHQARGAAAVLRHIPAKVLSVEELQLPTIVTELATLTKGLVLVTGPAGSGKSTTLAAMIDYINCHRSQHIITIEDPIEFMHSSDNCLITQREVYRDTHSFTAALRSALREDPDVILVGELRDLETIRLAMTAAETGHLVLASLHTNSATNTINRIIDVFPGDEKSLLRSMLSDSLQAVIAQRLLKKVGGGRIAACEIMISNPAIRHLIREDKLAQIYSTMQTSQAQGMITLDQHLMQLLKADQIRPQCAREVVVNKALF